MKNWKLQIATKLANSYPDHRDHPNHYYKVWHIPQDPSENPPYVIARLAKGSREYEVWKKVRVKTGDRFTDKNWKCISTHDSLRTAQTAVVMLYSTTKDSDNE